MGALETTCEGYGQAVIYKGTVPPAPHEHHEIATGKVFPVCDNTWLMLKGTRFVQHFDFIGSFNTHYGIFAGCGGDSSFEVFDTKIACC